MSLTVEPLNADTTFLLSFSPSFAPSNTSSKSPPDYTILIDPWLDGSSSILHPAFQISHHRSEPYINSLSELKNPPDIVLISQDKPDHCHKATLCSMPASWQGTNILAPPAAAKKILSWGYFDPKRIHLLPAYNADDEHSVVRIPIFGCSPSATDGEVTITNIFSKKDLTGLHNAIGITYQPASTVLTPARAYEEVEQFQIDIQTRGDPPRLRSQRSTHFAASVEKLRSRTSIPNLRKKSMPNLRRAFAKQSDIPPLPTKPSTSYSTSHTDTRIDSTQPTPTSSLHDGANEALSSSTQISPSPPPLPSLKAMRRIKPRKKTTNTETPISIIYTPHGISPRSLNSYTSTHLTPLGALPLTALFHSINEESNPWFMGGTVCNGASRGVEIAGLLRAKHWISAHDEVKENRGFATTWIRSRRFGEEEVEGLLRAKGLGTEVRVLGRGERLRVVPNDYDRDGNRDMSDLEGALSVLDLDSNGSARRCPPDCSSCCRA